MERSLLVLGFGALVCACAPETIFAPSPRLVSASFAPEAPNDARAADPAWVDIRGDRSSLCARDEKGRLACAWLKAVSTCTTVPCRGDEPHHFRVRLAPMPPIAATMMAVGQRGVWFAREGGEVSSFRFESDRVPEVEEVPWFRGALEIETKLYETFPAKGIAVSDTIRPGSTVCARMPTDEIRCEMALHSWEQPPRFRVPLRTTAVAVGWGFGCAITSARTVVCFGRNGIGQLGDGTRHPTFEPVFARGVTDAVAIDAGATFACAVREDGHVACWGRAGFAGAVHETPREVPNLANVAEVSLGLSHLCARLRSGSVTCIGENDHQQLGSVTASDDIGRSTIENLHDVVKLTSLGDATCALRADHAIICWGMNVAPERITMSEAP